MGFWEWQGSGGAISVAFLTLAFAAGIVLLALWVALPLAIFGLRSTLRELLEGQRETNRSLREIRHVLETWSRPLRQEPPPPQEGGSD